MIFIKKVGSTYAQLTSILDKYIQPLAFLAARVWIAKVFFKSGLNKVSNMETTTMLFEYEYSVPLLPPQIAAYMATAGELVLPVLLVLGIATRLGALGIFLMTVVIELFVFPGTTEHYYWLIIMALIFAHGGDKISLDYLIQKKVKID